MESTVVHHETELVVQLYFKSQQKKRGDNTSKESVLEIPDRVDINARSNSLKELRDIWKGWTPQGRLTFSQTYKYIGFLLHVFVDSHMIEALVEFWNPSYCCFTLDGVDLAPTIEEYTSLLHLAKLPTPYRTVTEVKVQNLRELMEKEGKEEAQLHLLALAIYGLLIFPKELGIIDHATITFVAQVKEGLNPVYGILAETFRSLNRCRIRRHARLTCYVPLLYVWMMSHLSCIQGFFRASFSTIRIPLAEFEVARWEEHAGRTERKDRLQNLVSKGIVWQAPWIDQPKVVYKCGNLPWVPLLGPLGGISYAPLMFRRQVGAIQFVPMTYGLADVWFTYEDNDSKRKIREFFVSWRHVYIVEATGQNSGV
ncbi:uncharacterized protein LOC131149529 [Malania oleifera]|uniref:uncharacterized protein LOC131149529 n=1 Tax=Malania oleifera TaxID=397392 RepID=UPI0025AEB333|nr:uncharacterized protein LOC131149529 [Malania oleifera]